MRDTARMGQRQGNSKRLYAKAVKLRSQEKVTIAGEAWVTRSAWR
jgi:hypothetical protein